MAAARPNFMKVAPVWRELSEVDWCRPVLVHAGQHYSEEMSESFLRDLGLPETLVRLRTGSGSHAEQTAAVLLAYEPVLQEERPACVVVVGDVNATMAATLAATKLDIRVAHLEAGLRSGDRSMPEELNRVVTDALSDLLWAPSDDAVANLAREGVAGRVELVGNIMLDTVELLRPRFEGHGAVGDLGLDGGRWAVATVHRPANVDSADALLRAVVALEAVADRLPLVFPVHPRTSDRLERHGLAERLAAHPGIHLLGPLPYVEFMALVAGAAVVVTDSGGVQEETTYLGIPCLTVRTTTERPTTVTHGTNRLVSWGDLSAAVDAVLASDVEVRPARPPFWDGHTAPRVAASLQRSLGEWG